MKTHYTSSLIYLTILVAFNTNKITGQCPVTVDAGEDVYLCAPLTPVSLNPTINGPFFDAKWTPTALLAQPTWYYSPVNITQTTNFVLTVRSFDPADNLVVNPDFELGNMGFTSSLTYSPGNIVPLSTYDVLANPQSANDTLAPCSDHTSGSGLMLATNTPAGTASLWCQTVPVTPYTDYYYSFWVSRIKYHTSGSSSIVMFINGQNAPATANVFNAQACEWRTNHGGIWNSGSNTTAELCLWRTKFSDALAIDDIFFGPLCTVTDTVTFFVENLTAKALPNTYVIPCSGYEITLNGAGSSMGPNVIYEWSTADGNIISGHNTLYPRVNAAGTYVLTVSLPGGLGPCVQTATVEVTESNAFSAWINSVQPLSCDAPIVLQGTTNQPASSQYAWTASAGGNIVSGQNSASAWINQPGLYTLVATNTQTGCSVETSVVVPPPNSPAITIQLPDTLSGTADTIQLAAYVAPETVTYAWTTLNGNIVSGATTASPYVSAPGTYVLTVTNTSTSCTATASVTVHALLQCPTGVYAGRDTFLCQPTQPATLDGVIDGAFYDLAWSPGQYLSDPLSMNPVATIEHTTEFIFAARVYDPDQNLVYNADFANGNAAFTSDLTHTPPGDLLMPGTYAVISDPGAGNASFPSCSDHGPGTGNMLVANLSDQPGIQQVYCTDIAVKPGIDYLLSCWALQLSGNPDLQIIVNSDTIGELSLPPDSCSWVNFNGVWFSDLNTTAHVCITTSDTAMAFALDDLFCSPLCTVQDTVRVAVAETPVVATVIAPDILNCIAESIELDASGSSNGPGISYLWNTADGHIAAGENTPTPQVDAPGTYQLILTDINNGCTSSVSVTVDQDISAPEITVAPPEAFNCHLTKQTLDAQNTAPSGTFSYQWTAGAGGNILNGANSLQPDIDAPGTYTLLAVNQENGCIAMIEISVIAYEDIAAVITTKEDISCFGAADGALAMAVSGGDSNYTYIWNNGANLPSLDNLTAGQYTVVITDGQGCSVELNADITQPNELLLNTSATPPTSAGGDDGTATTNPFGGIPPYTFAWSTGSNTATITGLTTGLYTVTVTDANGCTTQQTVQVGEVLCSFAATAVAVSPACHGSATGSATAQPLGGNAPFSYQWNTGETSETATGLTAGSYIVTITDVNGCEADAMISLDNPPLLTIEPETVTNATCPDVPDGTASIMAAGGTGNLNVVWSNGTQGPTATMLIAGDYTATVTDEKGCSESLSITIGAIDLELPVLQGGVDTLWLGPAGVISLTLQNINVSATDNCTLDKVEILPESFDCLSIGTNSVSVFATDVSGNQAVITFPVVIADNLPPDLKCPENIRQCADKPTVQYTAPVATDNCLMLGGFFDLLEGQPSGTVFPVGETVTKYTYTDASGNVGSCSFTVTIHTPLTVTLDQIIHDIGGQGIGEIFVSVEGSQPGYSYTWLRDGQTVSSTEDLASAYAGAYTLLVTDSAGCTTEAGPFVVDNLVGATDPGWASLIVIYPNPTSGLVYVALPETLNGQYLRFTVIDAIGRSVLEQTGDWQKQATLDFTTFADGLYMLLIRTGQGQGAYKIVLDR